MILAASRNRARLCLLFGMQVFVMLACACSDSKDTDGEPADDGGITEAGTGDGAVRDGAARDGAFEASLPGDAGSDGGDDADTGVIVTPTCGAVGCGLGQRCDVAVSPPVCVDNACSDLRCGATEECAPVSGGGHVCKSIACSSDVQCTEARYCSGDKCVDDACEPGVQRCDGNGVRQCASNGSADEARFVCGGAAYFTSACQEAASGSVGCTCEDDWDCPSFTACNAGTCEGTGVAPTCTLPALPFDQVLPTLEFRWGGTAMGNSAATGRAFPQYAQVVTTPVVANLDDDNGDGFINELDFPEIVFMAYAGSGDGVHHSGAVRAVHAGGPRRGQDYFALCGSTHWFRGDDVAAVTCAVTAGTTRPGGGLAVGDLDGNGVPELVVPSETGTLLILDNRGRIISESAKVFIGMGESAPNNIAWHYPQLSLANLDNEGLVEVITGNRVLTLEKTSAGVLRVLDLFTGPPSVAGQQPSEGAQDDGNREFGPTACVANVIDEAPNDGKATQEILAGTVLYRMPVPPPNVTRRSDCAPGDTSDFCQGRLTIGWDARVVNTTTAVPNREAYCAIADVLGAGGAAPSLQVPLDGTPEAILVSNGRLLVLRADTGALITKIDVEATKRGGAPNVDDFDGDGFPEIALASSGFYTVIDLQAPEGTTCPAWPMSLGATAAAPGGNPARTPGAACTRNDQCGAGAVCNVTAGRCVCLHNGWRRVTEDDSSRATSSSVFDFNGDGAAEVVYGDECYFRVYDGVQGDVRLAVPSVSRTVMENPVVADVDNDGNAEIVFVNNNETLQCGQTPLVNPDTTTTPAVQLPNGFQVWGDARDTWVSARRIWNQHAYHVTNITEGGQVPRLEPESWRPYGNRFYNTYRSQPRAFGVAPDLVLADMQVSSPDVACGQLSERLDLVVLVKNQGDLRVGPGVVLNFVGDFGAGFVPLRSDSAMPLTLTLQTSLEPGASQLVQASYRAVDNGNALPMRIAAIIDADNAERECKEDNNRVEREVRGGEQLADLALEVGATSGPCSSTKVSVRVRNEGSLAASDVLVRLFAGNPSAGGQPIGETTIAGPIAPMGVADAEITLGGTDRTIELWGIADPLDAVEECNNANNVDQGAKLTCSVIVL